MRTTIGMCVAFFCALGVGLSTGAFIPEALFPTVFDRGASIRAGVVESITKSSTGSTLLIRRDDLYGGFPARFSVHTNKETEWIREAHIETNGTTLGMKTARTAPEAITPGTLVLVRTTPATNNELVAQIIRAYE